MKTEAQIRLQGMNALINALGLVEAEQFIVAVSKDKLDYTQWRRQGLPDLTIDEIAAAANKAAKSHISEQKPDPQHTKP